MCACVYNVTNVCHPQLLPAPTKCILINKRVYYHGSSSFLRNHCHTDICNLQCRNSEHMSPHSYKVYTPHRGYLKRNESNIEIGSITVLNVSGLSWYCTNSDLSYYCTNYSYLTLCEFHLPTYPPFIHRVDRVIHVYVKPFDSGEELLILSLVFITLYSYQK